MNEILKKRFLVYLANLKNFYATSPDHINKETALNGFILSLLAVLDEKTPQEYFVMSGGHKISGNLSNEWWQYKDKFKKKGK